MIRRIICPFDLSAPAYNGAEYAAKFASAMNLEIVFISVAEFNPVAAAVGMGDRVILFL